MLLLAIMNRIESYFKKAADKGFDGILESRNSRSKRKKKGAAGNQPVFSTGGSSGGAFDEFSSLKQSVPSRDPALEKDLKNYEDVLDSYKTTVHFSKSDMIQVGEDVIEAISHFANMPLTYDYKCRKKRGETVDALLKERRNKHRVEGIVREGIKTNS